MPDLKDRIGVNYEVISKALVAKSLGSIVGAIVGGFTHERFYRHSELIIACGLWLGALSTLFIPFGKYLGVVALLFALSGVSEGVINAGKCVFAGNAGKCVKMYIHISYFIQSCICP